MLFQECEPKVAIGLQNLPCSPIQEGLEPMEILLLGARIMKPMSSAGPWWVSRIVTSWKGGGDMAADSCCSAKDFKNQQMLEDS